MAERGPDKASESTPTIKAVKGTPANAELTAAKDTNVFAQEWAKYDNLLKNTDFSGQTDAESAGKAFAQVIAEIFGAIGLGLTAIAHPLDTAEFAKQKGSDAKKELLSNLEDKFKTAHQLLDKMNGKDEKGQAKPDNKTVSVLREGVNNLQTKILDFLNKDEAKKTQVETPQSSSPYQFGEAKSILKKISEDENSPGEIAKRGSVGLSSIGRDSLRIARSGPEAQREENLSVAFNAAASSVALGIVANNALINPPESKAILEKVESINALGPAAKEMSKAAASYPELPSRGSMVGANMVGANKESAGGGSSGAAQTFTPARNAASTAMESQSIKSLISSAPAPAAAAPSTSSPSTSAPAGKAAAPPPSTSAAPKSATTSKKSGGGGRK